MAAVFLAAVLAFFGGQTAPVVTVWGGDHIDMEITDAAARFEFDCATGAVSAAIRPDAKGAFKAEGTFLPERSGPSRDDGKARGLKATYSGTIIKDLMTLRVVVDGQDPKGTTYQLTRGQHGNLRKCR